MHPHDARSYGDYCPISKTLCPGVCIFSEILENISLGIIIFDTLRERVIFQNQTAVELFQTTTQPKDYHGLRTLLLEEEIPFLGVGKTSTLQYGSKLLGYTIYHIIEGYVWVFIQDITEKVRLESIAEAVNAMDNIGYIFSGIRHEIGNPLNSIKMTISVLKNNLDKFSKETVREYIDRAVGEINRVEYLLKSLKSFSLYESPKMQQIDLESFFEKFLGITSGDFLKKGIEIKLVQQPGDLWGYTDPRALQQVMLNLLANAAEAMNGREAPEIDICVLKVEGRIKIIVADNGSGMTEEQQKQLFKPFYTSKPHGTGLGLVIVKKMLAKMDSTIDVKSYEDVGTLATISLPQGAP